MCFQKSDWCLAAYDVKWFMYILLCRKTSILFLNKYYKVAENICIPKQC